LGLSKTGFTPPSQLLKLINFLKKQTLRRCRCRNRQRKLCRCRSWNRQRKLRRCRCRKGQRKLRRCRCRNRQRKLCRCRSWDRQRKLSHHFVYIYIYFLLGVYSLAKYSLVLGYPPISVLCQWLKQIMALIDPLLFLLSFSEEIFIKNEFWNLEYLVFLKQKLFRCEFKINFATPWEFLEKRMILVLERLKLLKVHDEVTFCFYRRLE